MINNIEEAETDGSGGTEDSTQQRQSPPDRPLELGKVKNEVIVWRAFHVNELWLEWLEDAKMANDAKPEGTGMKVLGKAVDDIIFLVQKVLRSAFTHAKDEAAAE